VASSNKTSRDELPSAELKLLFARSRNQCAFRGCNAELVITPHGRALAVGEAAHIVAASRQGPRGSIQIPDTERDRSASNRLLLCHPHHREVDTHPTIYTVAVLRQMKIDHEGIESVAEAKPALSTEMLQSALLPVIGIPSRIYSASLLEGNATEGDIARALDYPKNSHGIVYPFLAREKRVLTFSDLRSGTHPFGPVVDKDVEETSVAELLSTDEGHRRVVALLNRAVGRHLGSSRVRFDREHNRYYFAADRDDGKPAERVHRYRTKTSRTQRRGVVHQVRRRKDGEVRPEWWHDAAQLRFERFAESWFLAIRPEFHLTSDGETPMPSNRIGRRVTRKKSHVYNDIYLNYVWFWKEFLCDGNPRLTIKVGEQSIVIDSVFATTSLLSPGVPGDRITVDDRRVDDNLFSLLELDEDDDDWFDDDELEDEGF
jgi:hypothetical protein